MSAATSTNETRIQQLQQLQQMRKKQIEDQKAKLEAMKASKFPQPGRKVNEILQDVLPNKDDLKRLKGPQSLNVFVPGPNDTDGRMDIFPFLGETYDKGCQTLKNLNDPLSDSDSEAGSVAGSVAGGSRNRNNNPAGSMSLGKKANARKNSNVSVMSKDGLGTSPAGESGSEVGDSSKKKPPIQRLLTEQEKAAILAREDFQSFFENASKVIEKQLIAPESKIILDYTNLSSDDLGDDAKNAGKLLELCDLRSERLTDSRAVNAVKWSNFIEQKI